MPRDVGDERGVERCRRRVRKKAVAGRADNANPRRMGNPDDLALEREPCLPLLCKSTRQNDRSVHAERPQLTQHRGHCGVRHREDRQVKGLPRLCEVVKAFVVNEVVGLSMPALGVPNSDWAEPDNMELFLTAHANT